MSTLRIAFLGDVFGARGRMVLRQQLPALRAEHEPDLVIVNAENARSGSGLSAELYGKLRSLGIDALTLGDHCYRDASIIPILEDVGEPIARPANLSSRAPGTRLTRLPLPGEPGRSVFVVTVLGRVFFPLPANDPFATVDDILENLPERDPLVIVEAHMEATSEKAALAHHLDGRVAAVLGTHTHVQTADARVLTRGTAFMTDLGMCGPYHSVIGRDVESVVRHMTTGVFTRFGMGEGDEAMCGAVVEIDRASGRALRITAVRRPADTGLPPFA